MSTAYKPPAAFGEVCCAGTYVRQDRSRESMMKASEIMTKRVISIEPPAQGVPGRVNAVFRIAGPIFTFVFQYDLPALPEGRASEIARTGTNVWCIQVSQTPAAAGESLWLPHSGCSSRLLWQRPQ